MLWPSIAAGSAKPNSLRHSGASRGDEPGTHQHTHRKARADAATRLDKTVFMGSGFGPGGPPRNDDNNFAPNSEDPARAGVSNDAPQPSSRASLTETGGKTSVRPRCPVQRLNPSGGGRRPAREFRAPARFASET